MNSKHFSKIVFLILLLSVFAINQRAQGLEQEVSVIILDPAGGTISNAKILLFSSAADPVLKETDKNGVATIRIEKNRKHKLEVSAEGFSNKTLEIDTGNLSKSMTVVLEVNPISEEVDINAESDLDKQRNIVPKELIDSLPDDPESFKRALLEIFGGNADTLITVNGVPVNELPPKSRIKQVRFNRNIFSAQYAGESGGGIEIITSSVIKKPKGYFSYEQQNSRFNARNPFHTRKEPLGYYAFRPGISFPMGQKTSLSLDAAVVSELRGKQITATILDNNFNPTPLNRSFDAKRSSKQISIDLNSEAFKRHQIYLKQGFREHSRNGFGVGALFLESRGVEDLSKTWTSVFSDTYTPTGNLYSQSSIVGTFSTFSNKSNSDERSLNVADAFYGGGANIDLQSRTASMLGKNDSVTSFGRLTLGFGGEILWRQLSEVNSSNSRGTYIFSGQIAPQLDSNWMPIFDANGNIIFESITSLESFRRNQKFRELGYTAKRIRELGGGAAQFSVLSGTQEFDVSQLEYAGYLQSSFRVRDDFGVSLGIRYENQSNLDDNLNFAPRIGISWSPKPKKNQNSLFSLPNITAGLGFFYSRFGISNWANFNRINSSGGKTFTILDSELLDLFPDSISIEDINQSFTRRNSIVFDSSLTSPRFLIGSVNVVKSLPNKFLLSIQYKISNNKRLTTIRNINAPIGGIFPRGTREQVLSYQSLGNQNSSSLRTQLRFPQWKLFGKSIYLSVTHDFQKSKSDVVTGSGSPFDPYDFSREYSSDINDGIHDISAIVNLSLPKNFQLNGMWRANTGNRFNIITGIDSNGDGFYLERPTYATDISAVGMIATKYGVLNPNPALGEVIIPRNLGVGPFQTSMDLFLTKWFEFNGDKKNKKQAKQRLRLYVDAYNVLNNNIKPIQIGNISSPNFLKSVESNEPDASDYFARRFRFGVGFYF